MISVFDMRLLADSWSTAEMRDVFSEENRIQKWLDVESALAKAQAELGIIPTDAAKEISKKAFVKNMDMDYIFAEFKKTKHPLVPTIRGLEKACDNGYGEFVHFGVTTQDIIDTGLILQIREGCKIIKRDIKDIARILLGVTKKYKKTPMMGRTLALQALPITFGHKTAIWLDEIIRHFERIVQCEERLYVGSIVGAVGTKAGLGEFANDVEKLTLDNLGLSTPRISWQPARDRLIELGYVLSNINATFNKIAHQILILSHNEINEINEPFMPGQVGSSTMPHKRNPAVSENAVTVSNTLKANFAILSDIERHEHERDGQVWKMEWKLIPEIFLMLSVVLSNMKFVLSGLNINQNDMMTNLNKLNGFVLAERVMLALSEYYGKQKAHEIVYELSMKGIELGKTFRESLLDSSLVTKYLNSSKIDELLDPTTYIGLAPEIVEDFLSSIEKSDIWK